jgi:hypothetical protein
MTYNEIVSFFFGRLMTEPPLDNDPLLKLCGSPKRDYIDRINDGWASATMDAIGDQPAVLAQVVLAQGGRYASN